jgi:hypothetical protein
MSTPAAQPVTEDSPADEKSSRERAFIRFLTKPNLAVWLAVAAVCLAAPSLFIGFHLDDFLGRYVYDSSLEGADRLYRVLDGGYALAKGNPAETHWQIEAGYAPWWTYDRLLLRCLRPIGILMHFDFRLWPSNAFLMHAHNIAWLAALVLVATRLYRGVLGTLVGGLAALLFALDHSHGFIVGFICNRHALLAGVFGFACLDFAFRSRAGNAPKGAAFFGPAAYLLALFSSESALAAFGYLVAYTVFVEQGSPAKRLKSFAPYLAATLIYRAVYNLGGYGGRGSGLYIDPARDPAHFLTALLERGPVLVLAEFFHPPAEFYVLLPHAWSRVHLGFAWLFVIASCVAFAPLVRRDRVARFWALGMAISLVPAASTYPHNRQLLYPSLGAMGLVAQLWHVYAVELKGAAHSAMTKFCGGLGAVVFFNHLVLSPIYAPVATCSVLFTSPIKRGAQKVGDEIADRDAVFMTAPDYFAVKIVQLGRRIDRLPLARRWRALSFGPQPVSVTRVDDRTLSLDYEGGILSTPFMELYRDRRLRMEPGDTVMLEGLRILVTGVTQDGRANRAEFRFDTPLEDRQFAFYYWAEDGFRHFVPPPVGGLTHLPGAHVNWGL